MNLFDYIVIIPVSWGIYKGFSKGIVIEIVSLLALLVGVYIAVRFSGYAETSLAEHTSINGNTLSLTAFALTFIATLIGIFFLGKLLDKVVKTSSLDIINRILGASVGGLKFLLLVSVVIYALNSMAKDQKFLSGETRSESYTYLYVEKLAPMIYPYLKNAAEKHYSFSEQVFTDSN